MCRSSRPEVFCQRSVLRIFANFTGKHQCQTLFLIKVPDLRLETLLKKRLWHRCFPLNSAKFLRTPFFIEQLWWLLLQIPHAGLCFFTDVSLVALIVFTYVRKSYLRNTMGQKRLSSITIINIERVYANQILKESMDRMI